MTRTIVEPLESRTMLAASITAVTYDYQSGPVLRYTFSAPVTSVSAQDLVLYNLSDRTTVPPSMFSVSLSGSRTTATFAFTGFAGHQLPEGNYQATIYASQITDDGGAALSADSTLKFHVFLADANRDRVVDTLDFNALAAGFGKTGQSFAKGDFNYDGAVDIGDFNLLAGRFGAKLSAAPAAPRVFDVVTFNASPDRSVDHFGQTQFDHLNARWPGGRFMCMGTDNHRAEIVANGNALGVYYNNLTVNIGGSDGFGRADDIQQYIDTNFTHFGLQPTYVVLNEISGSLWPNTPSYRQWVKDCVWKLHVVYGHEVILFSPFPNPGANGADWQYVSKYAYIGVEKYLSGATINANGNSVAWCLSQYQSSRQSYTNFGVPASRLILGEDFALTAAGTSYGRSGVSFANWDAALLARTQAEVQAGFGGFISYAWGKNAMQDTEANMVHFEDTYRAVPMS
jgi:hypothetical protein